MPAPTLDGGGSKSKLDALLFKVEEGCEDGDNALLSHGSRSVEILSNRNGTMQTQRQTQMQTQMHNAECRMQNVAGLPLMPELAGACSPPQRSGKRRSGQSSRSPCCCCGGDYCLLRREGVCWSLGSSFHSWEKVMQPSVGLNIACGPIPKPQQFSPMTRQHVVLGNKRGKKRARV